MRRFYVPLLLFAESFDVILRAQLQTPGGGGKSHIEMFQEAHIQGSPTELNSGNCSVSYAVR